MEEIKVDSIVSVDGRTTSTVGEVESQIIYTTENGVTSLAEATGPIIVLDDYTYDDGTFSFSGGTIIGINGSQIVGKGNSDDTMMINGASVIDGLIFSGNIGAEGAVKIATSNSVYLKNLSFTGNKSLNDGGVVYVSSTGSYTFENVNFSNNGSGGIYIVAGADVTVNGGSIVNNTSGSGAPAIWSRYTKSLTVNNVLISGNTTYNYAYYAIKHEKGSLNISGSTFSGNGCSVSAIGGTATITDTLFDQNNNACVVSAGADVVTVDGCTFSGNKGAFTQSGAGTLNVKNSLIVNDKGGQTIHKDRNGDVNISGSTFSGSTGPVMNVYDSKGYLIKGNISIENSLFENNKAVLSYAGSEGEINISGSTFVSNAGIAVNIANNSYSTVRISGSTFSGTQAAATVFMAGDAHSTLYIDGCLFTDNNVSNGGGVYSTRNGSNHNTVYISNSTFSGNSATTYGGAIRIDPGTELHLSNVTIVDNVDPNDSAIHSYNGTIYVEGLLTLGKDQRVMHDGTAYLWFDGGSFFSGKGVAKAVETNRSNDNWYTWTNYSSSSTYYTTDSNYKLFVMDGDIYVTNVANVVVAGGTQTKNNPYTTKINIGDVTVHASLADAITAGASEIALYNIDLADGLTIDSALELVGVNSNFGGTITIGEAGSLALSGDYTLTSALTVTGGVADLSGAVITVSDELITAGSTLASGVTNVANIIVNDEAVQVGEVFDFNAGKYFFTNTDDLLKLNAVSGMELDTAYVVNPGTEFITIGDEQVACTVTNGIFNTIADAAATTAEVVVLDGFTHSDGSMAIFTGNTLTGKNGALITGVSSSEAAAMTTHVIDGDINVSGLTFSANNSTYGLALVLVKDDESVDDMVVTDGQTITISDCHFDSNNVGGNAGVVLINTIGGTHYLNNVSFNNNDAGLYVGRHISAEEETTVIMTGGSFTNQGASLCDAKVNYGNGDVTFDGVLIENNKGNEKALFYRKSGTLTVKNSTINNNLGRVFDFSIASGETAGLVVENTTISNSGVYWIVNACNNVTAEVKNSTFTSNGQWALVATGNGKLNVEDSTFTNSNGMLMHSATTGSVTIKNCYVENASNSSYGAIYKDNFDGEFLISGSTFVANNVSALKVTRRSEIDIENTLFSGNGGKAILATTDSSNTGYDTVINISGCTFATASDAIDSIGTINFSGENVINAAVGGTGTFTVGADTTMTFGETGAFNGKKLTFTGKNVTFTNAINLSNVAITVDAGMLDGMANSETWTIASGISAMNSVITVGDTTVTLGEETQISGGKYTYEYNQTAQTLTVTSNNQIVMYDKVYVVPQGTESIVINGVVYDFSDGGVFNDVASALEALNDNGTLVIKDLNLNTTSVANEKVSHLIVAGGSYSSTGAALYVNEDANGDATVEVQEFVHSGNSFFLNNSGNISGNYTVTVRDSEAGSGHLYLASGNIGGNVTANVIGSDIASFYVISANCTVGGTATLNVTGSHVGGINLTAQGSDVTICSGVVFNITNSVVDSRIAGTGSASDPTINGDIVVNLTGSTAYGDLYGSRSNKVKGNIYINLTGSTVANVAKFQTDNVDGALTLTVSAKDALTASVITGTVSNLDNLVIESGATLKFDSAQDLSGVNISIATGDITTDVITVATGISNVGTVSFTGANKDLFGYTLNEGVLTYQLKENEISGTKVVGENGALLVTGGGITGTAFSSAGYQEKVVSVVTDGTIGKNLLGGVWSNGGVDEKVESVSLDIAGGEVKGYVYSGGYLIGSSSDIPTEAQMNVGNVALTLTGGEINKDIYGGIHVRENGYGKADSVAITINGDGVYGNVFGGGWAERNAKSEVGAVTISVTGGEINRLFAGGGASLADTTNISSVGTSEVTISGGTVNYVYLSGLNQQTAITGSVQLTVDAENSFKLITGYDFNGADSTDVATGVEIKANVICDTMSNIEKLTIGENCTLTLGNAADIDEIVFDADGEFDWTALSADNLETAFASTKFVLGDGNEFAGLDALIASDFADFGENNKSIILKGTLA